MELIWRNIYDNAVHQFGGQRPGAQLEAQLIERFEQQPAALNNAIQKLAERYAAGKIRSPWALILPELDHAPDRDRITATDEGDKARATRLAEIYITNAGLYLPSEAELLDDTFGDHGRLHPWAHDQQLREQITAHWHAQQPRAQAAIQAAIARGHTIRDQRARKNNPEPDADIPLAALGLTPEDAGPPDHDHT